jgi:hypothetical protein
VANYIFRAVSANTGIQVAELPLSAVKFTRSINSAGPWSGLLRLSDAIQALDPIDATTPNQIEIVIERDQQVVYTGLLIDREYDSSAESLSLSGRESWAYFDRRLIESNLTYSSVDQGLIVQDLLYRARLSPQGDFRIDLPSLAALTTGVTRIQSYLAVDCKPISEAIQELAAQHNGFEFHLDGYWSANTLRHELVFGFPQLGGRGISSVKWELPGAISSYRWQEQGGAQANEIFGIGDDGSGHVALKRIKALRVDLPLLQRSQSFRAIADPQALLDWTLAASVVFADPAVKAFVIVLGSLPPQLGTYSLGDDVTLQFNDPRFEGQISIWRLMGWSVSVPDQTNPETVELQVEQSFA